MKAIYFRLSGFQQLKQGFWNEDQDTILLHGQEYKVDNVEFASPLSGTVYGTLLNYKGALQSFRVDQGPYQKLPEAPVLYVKPVNTITAPGAPIPVPEHVDKLQMGACLGIVFGNEATKVSEKNALDFIEGYVVVNDVQIPHDDVYRPAIQEIARDGFCPAGPWIVDKEAVVDPDNLLIQVSVNETVVQQNTTRNLVRPIRKLIADITEFMTFYPGDVLLVGIPENPPLAGVGDRVLIEIEGIGRLENVLQNEKALAGDSHEAC